MGTLTETTAESYEDYVFKRRLSRTSFKKGDTAVMGWRPSIDLPYWIHKAMCRGGYNNPWSWVFEPGVTPLHNSAKFRSMFPEFSIRQDDNEEIRRVKQMEKDNHKWDTYEKAEKYLAERLKDRRTGVAL